MNLEDSDLSTGRAEVVHEVFVSSKIWKVLTRSRDLRSSVLLELRNEQTQKWVVATCSRKDSIALPSEGGVASPCVLVPPNILTSLGVRSGETKILVSEYKQDLSQATQVIFAEMFSSAPQSMRVHELVLTEFLKHNHHFLTVGEVFGLPIWSRDNSRYSTEISEPSSVSPHTWIGPGRAIDTTHAMVYYKVVDLRSENNIPLDCASVNSGTRFLMTASRRHEVLRIPGMTQFFFPGSNTPSDASLVDWMCLSDPSVGLVIGPSCMQRTAVIEASAERAGFFCEIINCRFKTNQSVLDRISSITARNSSIILLDNFDSFDDVLVPSVLSGLKCLVVIEDYESAVKKVPSPFTFQYFFELSGVSDHQPLSEAYSRVVSRCPLLDTNACMHQLDQRLSKLGVQEEQTSPDVAWEDIGGLETAKQELRDLMSSGLRRGILLYGPPGTGKTLLAKAIATEASKSNGKTTFISVKGPELLSMYIGESEKNVRSIFEKARSCRPAVIFFDELDSLAPARGRASDSANVMDRVVASLLTELDNLPPDVIVVAATNRPDLLDSSLVRPGRIDRQVYVGIPENKSEILNSLARKFCLDTEVVAEVLPYIPRAMTGSDLAGVLRKAYLACAKRVDEALQRFSAESGIELNRIQAGMELNERYSSSACRDHCWKPFERIEKCDACNCMRMGETILTRDDLRVRITVEDVVSALESTAPSVSESELRTYEELRDRRATVIG